MIQFNRSSVQNQACHQKVTINEDNCALLVSISAPLLLLYEPANVRFNFFISDIIRPWLPKRSDKKKNAEHSFQNDHLIPFVVCFRWSVGGPKDRRNGPPSKIYSVQGASHKFGLVISIVLCDKRKDKTL